MLVTVFVILYLLFMISVEFVTRFSFFGFS